MSSSLSTAPKWAGVLGAIWAVLGVCLILGMPVFRLGQKAMESWGMRADWGIWHWVLLVAFLVFMGYSEGYKGFQKAFSPRCAARVRHLKDHPTWLRVLLAPLFAMAFFHATKKRLIVSYVITVMVICFILMFRLVDQPWRGILDAGVVLGLSWGLIAFLVFLVRAMSPAGSGVDPEVA